MQAPAQRKPKAYTLAADEKATLVMIYTLNSLIRGEAITKESIRVSIWLRTQSAPEYIHMLKTTVVFLGGNVPVKPVTYPEFIVAASQILAFHIAPPNHDPMDYEESEANRIMEPVTALVGAFRFNGLMRISTATDVSTNLAVSRSPWLSLYHVSISSDSLPAIGTIQAPMLVVRPNQIFFGINP